MSTPERIFAVVEHIRRQVGGRDAVSLSGQFDRVNKFTPTEIDEQGRRVMGDHGSDEIGAALARLQADVRELRMTIAFEREERLSGGQNLLNHVNREVAMLHGRADALDARFAQIHQTLGEMRQDILGQTNERFDKLETLLRGNAP